MKVIKNYWKSCLCFLLAFLCILGVVYQTDFLSAVDVNGGGAPKVAPSTKTTSYAGGTKGVSNIHGYRLSVIDLDDNGNQHSNDNGWAYVDSSGVLHTNLGISKTGYETKNWFYYTFNVNGFNSGGASHHTWLLGDGDLYDVGDNVMSNIKPNVGTDNAELQSLFNTLGVSDYSSETAFTADLDSKIRGIDLDGDTAKALKRTFGIAENDTRWIVVIECLQAYGYGGGGSDGFRHFIWYGHTGYNCDNGTLGGWYSKSSNVYNSIGWRGSSKEYGVSLIQEYTMWDSTSLDAIDGYVVYGALAGDGGNKSLANVSVTYTGEPNTSDASKFTSKGTVGGYIDGSLQNWNGSDWSSGFSVNMSTTGSNYTLVYSGTSKLTADKKTSVNDIINKGNSIGGLNLTWSTYEVSGDIHKGVTTTVNTVDGYKSTQAIADKLSGISGITNSSFSGADFSGQTGTTDITSAAKATCTKAANAYSTDKAISKKGNFKKGETLGLGTEFIIKGSPVTSNHYIITVNNNGASVTKSEDLNYTTNSVGSVTTQDNAVAVVVAKRNTANTNANAVKNGLNSSMTPQNVVDTLTGNLSNVEVKETDASSRNVTLGHDTSNNNEGYVVYEVVSGDTPDLTGTTELEDWFLNKYTNNILETAYKKEHSGSAFHFGINTTHTVWKDSSCYAKADCGANLLVRTNKDYETTYKLDTSGTEIDYDASMKKYYYPASASTTFNGTDSIYKYPVTINTKTYDGARNIDYAFNFIRSATGDVRSISGITYARYTDIGDSFDILKMEDAFGVVPSTVKTTAVGKSKVSGTLSEVFKFSSIFKRTGTEHGFKDGASAVHGGWVNYHTYGTPQEVKDNVTGEVTKVPNVCRAMYYLNEPVANINTGLIFNISSGNKFTYTLTGIAYKYQTAELAEGKNSLLGDKDVHGVATSANKPTGATKKDTNEYRYATVNRNSNVSLSFYPENYMVCKIGRTVFDTSAYKYVTVMSEVKRKAQSSSLYLVKVNTDIADDSTITGSTYSDTMQGGTSSLGNNKVSIPAGSDVTVLADPTNVKIDLFGYALDLIDGSKDSVMKTGSHSSLSYGSVVKSDTNVASVWGNAGDHADKLKSNFTTWADNVMKVENFGADFVLDVNNNTKGANFSATIGKVNHTSGAVEDGVYNISVMNGKVLESDVMEGDKVKVSSGAYKQLITQLAADYDCSYDEANALFKDSKIYTAILSAIESSTSSFNTSGKTSGVAESWTSTLGNGTNWYDERVRTFVIRRYTNLGNTLSDITATDKLDYSLAPTGDASGKENASAGTTYDAKWSLNLFFNSAKKSDLDKLIFENGTYFDPSTNTDVTGANNAYTVLINKTPVKNADFLIPASSTSNFGF